LFPGAVDSQYVAEEFFTLPGSAILERAFPLACLRWHDIEILVDGLWGGRTGRPVSPAIRDGYRADPACLTALRDIQTTIREAVRLPDDSDPLHLREDVGLQAMDPGAVFGLDEILRLDCHSRLLWLGDTEMAFDVDGPDPEAVVPLTIDRGVFTVVVPESLPGLVALDFVETLRLDPRTALCAVCRRPILLSPQQAARQRKGEPVYHPDCHDEHRLRYVREFQRRRRASRPATDAAAEHAM
jgi:hypothetical protein